MFGLRGSVGFGVLALGVVGCGFSSAHLRPELSQPGAPAYEVVCKTAAGCASEAADVCEEGYVVLSSGEEYRPNGLEVTVDLLSLFGGEDSHERDTRQERRESHVMVIRCQAPMPATISAEAEPARESGQARAQGGRRAAEQRRRQVALVQRQRRKGAAERDERRRTGSLSLRDGLIGRDGALAAPSPEDPGKPPKIKRFAPKVSAPPARTQPVPGADMSNNHD